MSKRIKILYIAPTLDMGGAERFLTDLIINLDQKHFSPHLLLFKRGGVWLSEITAENIPVTILNKKRKIDLFNFYKIFKTIRGLRPDIVHTQLGGDIYGRLAAKLAGVKIIVSTEHNVHPNEPWLLNRLKKWSARYANIIVAVSAAVRQDAMNRYGLELNKTKTISNGLDIRKFSFSAHNIKPQRSRPKFGTIGRLSPQKGHSYLVEAWSAANLQADCLIAGEGDLRPSLEKQISEFGLGKSIKLVGPVNNVPAFLFNLDAFIFPSIWEGQGIVLMEAGLSMLPIIASEVDGITEVLDKETAWLVPAGDSAALAKMLTWLKDNLDSPEVKIKTEKLYKRINDLYSLEKTIGCYKELYLKLMNQ